LPLGEQDKLDEAIVEYKKAIDLDPRDAHTQISGVILCDVKRDYDGAITEFRKAINLDPKDAVAHHNLAVALSNADKFSEAVAGCPAGPSWL
jgi:superkiller protein 3